MPLTLRPATAHTHSVGTPEYSFLNGYFDYLYTLLISSVNMSVSGTIAAGNLTCTNRIVGKIFAIVESDVDIMYIDKYLAKFPQDGEFARNLTVGSKLSAVTAEISLAIKTKDLLVESALETGTALVNGMLQVEGSTWLKGGLTVQGDSSVNGSLNVNGSLAGHALSGTSLNVGSGGITGGSISGSSGNFAGGSVTAGTFIGALSGNATTATSASAAPWSGISGKPSTFTPSAHTHPMSDITGLTTISAYTKTVYDSSTVTGTGMYISESYLSVPVSGKYVLILASCRGKLGPVSGGEPNFGLIEVRDSSINTVCTLIDWYNPDSVYLPYTVTGHAYLYQPSEQAYRLYISAYRGYIDLFGATITVVVFP